MESCALHFCVAVLRSETCGPSRHHRTTLRTEPEDPRGMERGDGLEPDARCEFEMSMAGQMHFALFRTVQHDSDAIIMSAMRNEIDSNGMLSANNLLAVQHIYTHTHTEKFTLGTLELAAFAKWDVWHGKRNTQNAHTNVVHSVVDAQMRNRRFVFRCLLQARRAESMPTDSRFFPPHLRRLFCAAMRNKWFGPVETSRIFYSNCRIERRMRRREPRSQAGLR